MNGHPPGDDVPAGVPLRALLDRLTAAGSEATPDDEERLAELLRLSRRVAPSASTIEQAVARLAEHRDVAASARSTDALLAILAQATRVVRATVTSPGAPALALRGEPSGVRHLETDAYDVSVQVDAVPGSPTCDVSGQVTPRGTDGDSFAEASALAVSGSASYVASLDAAGAFILEDLPAQEWTILIHLDETIIEIPPVTRE